MSRRFVTFGIYWGGIGEIKPFVTACIAEELARKDYKRYKGGIGIEHNVHYTIVNFNCQKNSQILIKNMTHF